MTEQRQFTNVSDLPAKKAERERESEREREKRGDWRGRAIRTQRENRERERSVIFAPLLLEQENEN